MQNSRLGFSKELRNSYELTDPHKTSDKFHKIGVVDQTHLYSHKFNSCRDVREWPS